MANKGFALQFHGSSSGQRGKTWTETFKRTKLQSLRKIKVFFCHEQCEPSSLLALPLPVQPGMKVFNVIYSMPRHANCEKCEFLCPFLSPQLTRAERGAGAGPGGVVILWRLMGVGLNPTLVLYKKKNKTSSAIPVTARWPRRVSLPQFPRWENSSSSLGLHFLTPSNFPSGDSY